MDGKEVYNHDMVLKLIRKFTRKASKMGANMLETQKACEAIAISCENLIREGLEKTYVKEETPSEN